jgi:hypothetical protein
MLVISILDESSVAILGVYTTVPAFIDPEDHRLEAVTAPVELLTIIELLSPTILIV